MGNTDAVQGVSEWQVRTTEGKACHFSPLVMAPLHRQRASDDTRAHNCLLGTARPPLLLAWLQPLGYVYFTRPLNTLLMLHRSSDPIDSTEMPVSTGATPILKFSPHHTGAKHKMIIRRHESLPDKLWRCVCVKPCYYI